MADRRRWGTVRVRVTALATIAVAVVLVAAGALLVARQRSDLIEQLDDGCLPRALMGGCLGHLRMVHIPGCKAPA